MARIIFTSNLARHIDCPSLTQSGASVRELLDNAFTNNSKLKRYILDDQDRLRRHMLILVNGIAINDRIKLSDAVDDESEVYIMQALSGG